MSAPPAFALKAPAIDAAVPELRADGCKTMYGGRQVASGATVYLFEGARGLIGRGVAIAVEPLPRPAGAVRHTPRVTLTIRPIAPAARPLGRAELRGCAGRADGSAEAELDFKLYRQATDKLVGLSETAARLLADLCPA